ncbi:hypothetical protein J4425_02655 [Candidatus Woesearchaeota archaeon]|nr:hypothetical protein [Candidatus Woesearchaeota archaeon]
MKKILLLVLLALFIVPFVSADITFNNDFYEEYNMGDVVEVQGYVLSDSNVDDIFRLYLVCGGDSQILSGKMIHVSNNQNYYFAQDVNLPVNSNGICHFNADFNDENEDSEDFQVTDELKGDIFVTSTRIKLGEPLNVEGDVYRLSDDRISGFGILTLSKDSEEFLVDSFDITNGDIAYNFILDSLPAGDYDLQVEVYDYYGNSHIFTFAQKIQVINELTARVSLETYEVLQGNNLKILGAVDDADSYEVYIEYEGKSETLNFYSAGFEYDVKLGTLGGGSHTILVRIVDSYGNFYLETLGYEIISVPDRMDVEIGDSVLPGDSISLGATIYDKADYIYQDEISVRILNPKGEKIGLSEINSGESSTYEVEDYTAPGIYKAVFESPDFNVEREFTVNTLEKIDAYFEDNRLKVKNVGNVDLSDDFNVLIGGSTVDFSYSLKPSEIGSYDLRGWVSQGVYTASVSSDYGDIQVDVELVDDRTGFQKVTGFVVGANGGSPTLLWLILIIVVAAIVYFVFFRKKPTKRGDVYEGDYNKHFEEGKSMRERVMEKRNRLRTQPKRLFPSKEIPKRDADNFRDDMVRKMKER